MLWRRWEPGESIKGGRNSTRQASEESGLPFVKETLTGNRTTCGGHFQKKGSHSFQELPNGQDAVDKQYVTIRPVFFSIKLEPVLLAFEIQFDFRAHTGIDAWRNASETYNYGSQACVSDTRWVRVILCKA